MIQPNTTQQPRTSLRQKAISGVTWSAIERFGTQGIQFLIQLILARLLLPEQFGLIAMVAVFLTISSSIIDCGFGKAIIQKKELTDADVSTVFYFNILTACLMAALLWILAPFVADLYKQPSLTWILQILSINLIIGAFGTVHISLIQRRMEFKKFFKISIPSLLISGLVGIILAWMGYGVWALVTQAIISTLGRTVFLWIQSGWRPLWTFSRSSIRTMFPYGSRLAVAGILDQGFQNAYVLIIGIFYSSADVGFFQRAKGFYNLPATTISSIIGKVAFPLFASIQDNNIQTRLGLKKGIQLSSLALFPLMAIMSAVAEPMVIVLIGEKWLPCVPMLQWLCVQGALYPIHALNLSVLSARGRSDLFLRLEVLKKAFIAINIAITFSYGIQAMIYGMVITSFIALIINTYYTRKIIQYGLLTQLRDLTPNGILAICIYVSIRGLLYATQHLLFSYSPILSSFLQLTIAGVASLIILWIGLCLFPISLKSEIRSSLVRLPMGNRMAKLIL